MTADEALAFLRQHQPMPSDHSITDDEGSTYAAIVKHFEEHPDPRCVPLLIGSVSEHTGLGMYEHINFVLMRLPKDEVVPHLRHALRNGDDAQKARCCWWALDISAWELQGEIEAALKSEDEDLRGAAEAFFELKQ